MRFCGTLLLVLACLVPAAAAAQSTTFEDYYPTRVKQVLVFDYSLAAEGEKQRSYQGTLTRSPGAPETHDGVTYQVVEHTTRGLPDFYPARWKSYHRETEDGLYTGHLDDAGRIEEYLEFPASAEPGEPWATGSAFWEAQTFAPMPRVETAAGTFEHCIRVERFREDAPGDQTLSNTTTYCPGLGAVHGTVEHVSPMLRSVTEFRLVEIRR